MVVLVLLSEHHGGASASCNSEVKRFERLNNQAKAPSARPPKATQRELLSFILTKEAHSLNLKRMLDCTGPVLARVAVAGLT